MVEMEEINEKRKIKHEEEGTHRRGYSFNSEKKILEMRKCTRCEESMRELAKLSTKGEEADQRGKNLQVEDEVCVGYTVWDVYGP